MESSSPYAPYHRIVVPIDGSDAAKAALRYAMDLHADEIVIVHVSIDRDIIVPEWVLENDDERHEATPRDVMEELARTVRDQGQAAVVDMRIGDVSEEIIAAGRAADLIVMMTHGRGAAGRMIFGSMADRVVRHSETPVLLVRLGELTRHPRQAERLVLALDGSALADRAVPTTIRLARTTELPVTIIRSVGLQDVKARLRDERDRQAVNGAMIVSQPLYASTLVSLREEAAAWLDDMADTFRAEGIDVTTRMTAGPVPSAILDELTPNDLLVITTRGQGGYRRWALGSVAEKLIREAPCPVLVQRGREDIVAGA